jgi:hypothetical protein
MVTAGVRLASSGAKARMAAASMVGHVASRASRLGAAKHAPASSAGWCHWAHLPRLWWCLVHCA